MKSLMSPLSPLVTSEKQYGCVAQPTTDTCASILSRCPVYTRLRISVSTSLFDEVLQIFHTCESGPGARALTQPQRDRALARALNEITHRASAVCGRIELAVTGKLGDPMVLAPTEVLEHGPELTWLAIAVPTPFFDHYVGPSCGNDATRTLWIFEHQLNAMFQRLDACCANGSLQEVASTLSKHHDEDLP